MALSTMSETNTCLGHYHCIGGLVLPLQTISVAPWLRWLSAFVICFPSWLAEYSQLAEHVSNISWRNHFFINHTRDSHCTIWQKRTNASLDNYVNCSISQTRHNFLGGNRIFSVKICINPYPSSMHWCIATFFMRFVSRCSLQKIA